ncbi:hypothetical protein A1O1_08666 [Capronia coronata CBS 617.96]|uniref:Uncharacterized protein n=1 Tax=Capronia coronata CBS 617.96 TaxID=1182541 RepID=W9XT57_9EURO|nr:uncharacterized protein A1O1_08666 [Capronia coronata CBS 617.96]EXJ80520.1 hypothetical protein A1O1_08666 [Capronia coronata CBS 617.96]
MASHRVQHQLAKQLEINAAGTALVATPRPTTLQNPTPQQPFPTYHIGYNPLSNVGRVAQAIPPRPANGHGSAHPFEMLAEENLHPVLFRLEPGPDRLHGVPVPLLVDQATGLIEHGNGGRPLRFFSHLPRWIAANVSGMLMELWIRLDPRVEMSDIIDRVNAQAQVKMPRANTLIMRRIRFREIINVPALSPGRQMPTANEVQLIGNLSREQILLNTAMAVDLAGNRLLQPRLVNGKTILGYIDSGLAVDHYIADFCLPIPIPSGRMVVSLELRKRLQTLARRRGLGNTPTDYHKLSRDLAPSWWVKKGEARPMADLDGKSHEEFVGDLLGQHPPATARARVRRPVLPSAAAAATVPPTLPLPAAPMVPMQPPRTSAGAAPPIFPPTPLSGARNAAALFHCPGQANAASGTAVPAGATVNSGLIDPRLLVAASTTMATSSAVPGVGGLSAGASGAGVRRFHVVTPTGTSNYVEAATAEAARQVARPASSSQTAADHGNRSDPGAGGYVWGEEEARAARYLREFIARGG